MTEALLPCPFCGSDYVELHSAYKTDRAECRAWVRCESCGATMHEYPIMHLVKGITESDEIVTKRWNRRAERTCRMEYNEEWSRDELYPTECYNCSECGHMTFDGVPTFCPNCGARVTKEASDDADR